MSSTDLLDQAIADYRDATARCARYTLAVLAEAARAQHPTAALLVFDWSDQGDFLTLDAVLDEAGEDLDPDCEVDENAVAWNLDRSNSEVWQPLNAVESRARDVLDGLARIVIPVEDALSLAAPPRAA